MNLVEHIDYVYNAISKHPTEQLKRRKDLFWFTVSQGFRPACTAGRVWADLLKPWWSEHVGRSFTLWWTRKQRVRQEVARDEHAPKTSLIYFI